jgi:ComF family protein
MRLPRIVRDVVDFVYPACCAACGGDGDPDGFLCHSCAAALDALAAAPACEYCGLPIADIAAPCPWCRGGGFPPLDRIVRLGKFDDPLKTLIHRMKYRRRWPLAPALAARVLEEERARRLLADADVLVPVPLHWRRQIARGYNQADLLAAALARRTGLKLIRAARRVRSTESQTAIHARALRESNVRGAFSATKLKSLAGKRIVIVDDVMTTAATLRALGRAIKTAKPASISALVLAVADPRRRDFTGI